MSATPDPFDVRMVFFRVGWMDKYEGVTSTDKIIGGGKYVEEHGFGFEAFNFCHFNEQVYGWVEPGKASKNGNTIQSTPPVYGDAFAKINIVRIGASKEATSLSKVLVVWVATHPEGNAYVVGWYQNATVFKKPEQAPTGSHRFHNGSEIGYVTTANANDAVLLPPDSRNINVPQGGKGKFGQSNTWFADDIENPIHRELRMTVLNAVKDRTLPQEQRRSHRQTGQEHDVLKRQRVEKTAIETVTKHYSLLGYEVRSVEQDNVGWDLEATLDKRNLKLEVKGLSGSDLVVDLTPNEYAKMNEQRKTFRLCTVTDALSDPYLAIFQFHPESGHWESNDGRILAVNEVVSARCSATPRVLK